MTTIHDTIKQTAQHGIETYRFLLPMNRLITTANFIGIIRSYLEHIDPRTAAILACIDVMTNSFYRTHQTIKTWYWRTPRASFELCNITVGEYAGRHAVHVVTREDLMPDAPELVYFDKGDHSELGWFPTSHINRPYSETFREGK